MKLIVVQKYKETKPAAPPPVAPPAQPPVVIVKTEPLDPLKMDMDDEAEIADFDLERVGRQVASAATGDGAPPPAPGEPEPDTILRLAEFVAPPPVKLSKAQRDAALATIDRRAYAAAGEVDLAGAADADAPGKMTRGAELQAVLLVRSITRSGLEASAGQEEKGEGKDEDDMRVDVPARGRDALREKLCAYILEDLPARCVSDHPERLMLTTCDIEGCGWQTCG